MKNQYPAKMLDDLLDLLRPYFEAEHDFNERVAQCETEADLIARQREALLAEARQALRDELEAQGMRFRGD